MKVETHNNLNEIHRFAASRVVVYDDYDNPVCVVMKMQHGRITVVRAGDKRFADALHMLGINQTVIVDTIDAAALPRLHLK